jgi:hypothetical protein
MTTAAPLQEFMQDTTKYARRCSRWQRCSVNHCKLMPPEIRQYQQIDRMDPNQVCLENLRDRLRIVEEARADGIELGTGLTDREARLIASGKATIESLIAEFDRKHAGRLQRVMEMHAGRATQKAKTGVRDEGTPEDDPEVTPEHEASTDGQ